MAGLAPIDPSVFLEYSAMDRSKRVLQNGTPEAKQTIFMEELLKNVFLKSFFTQSSALLSDEEDDEDSDIISKENTSNGTEIYNRLMRDFLAKELAENKSFGFNKEIIKRIENGGAKGKEQSDD